jgi:hypothetical protein
MQFVTLGCDDSPGDWRSLVILVCAILSEPDRRIDPLSPEPVVSTGEPDANSRVGWLGLRCDHPYALGLASILLPGAGPLTPQLWRLRC